MRVNVYIDGFNLYYGALKGQPYRWLNLLEYAQTLLHPSDTVNRLHYFTARVKAQPGDPNARSRQDVYLRAIDTLPGEIVTVHHGLFLSNTRWMPRADGTGNVRVIKTEEKGSDVNLASHLLLDAHDGDYEAALVISNDSDLVEPIRLVQQRFGLPVGIGFPVLNANRKPSVQLRDLATFERVIDGRATRRKQLAESQFDSTLSDARGTFTKPAGW